MTNDPIELYFSLNRYLGGYDLALNISTSACNKRTLLLNLVTKLCKNNDKSYNKILCKLFFNNTQKIITILETNEINRLKNKWSTLTSTCSANS